MTHPFRQPTCFSAPPRQLSTTPTNMECTVQDALDHHLRETEADEMPGGCMLDTHDGGGEEDGSTSAGNGNVGKGKQRMMSCEGVEDEDMVRRAKVDSTDEEEDESEEDVFHSFGEDEDEGDEDESEEEDEDEEDDEHQLEDRSPLLWRCESCGTTVNIFARDDHLRSRAHLRNTGIKPHAAHDDSVPSYTWRCTLCAEAMSVFHRADHLASKTHLKAVAQCRAQNDCSPLPGATPPDELADLPALARSSSFNLRNAFYCITCAAEFDSAEQAAHLATSAIWDCEVCGTHLHPAARDAHLDSESHAAAKRRSKAPEEDFICSVCERVYMTSEKEDHLAGTGHRTALARNWLEQLYLEEKRQAGPSRPRAANDAAATGWTEEEPAVEPWHCNICDQDVDCQWRSSHRYWCTTRSNGVRPSPKKPKPKKQQPKEPTNTPKPKKAKTKKKETPTALYCEVCKRYIHPSGMASHKSSKKHMAEAAKKAHNRNPAPPSQPTTRAIASAQHITVSGGTFHCAVCGRDRSIVGIEGHVNSKTHRKRLAARQAH